MLKAYRPAGNSITLSSSDFDGEGFSPFRLKLYQSGTAALSAAILTCIKLSNLPAQVTEIIIPAYACPDLVSAILHAGAKPVLVDLEPKSPHLYHSSNKKNITDSTIAVIAVNFLGIPEKVTQIRQVCNEHGLFLIIDSAQWFPKTADTEPWAGDFNIISFGRGKSVNLLSRGAVLTTRADFFNTLQEGTSDDISNRSSNSTIDRAKYSQISVSKFSSWEIHNKLKTISSQNLVDLLPDNATEENTVLLRYPILIKNRSIRDKFFRQTKEYGVSILYPRPLNEISGLEGILDSQSFPCANEFSDHLVTLPTHEHVDKKLIYNILAVLKKEPGRQP